MAKIGEIIDFGANYSFSTQNVNYNFNSPTTRIRCNLTGANVVVDAQPGWIHLEFNAGNNWILDVPTSVVPDLLSKKQKNKACCGGNSAEIYLFEVVE
jgi:hypothetical protein